MKIFRNRRLILIAGALILIIALLLGSCTKPAPVTTPASTPVATPATTVKEVKPINLKLITMLALNHPINPPIQRWIERVNYASGGRLNITLAGGPEIIAAVDQAEAVKTGVVDLIHLAPTYYYKSYVPEMQAVYFSELDPMEERARGYVDYIDNLHQTKMNVKYLGASWGSVFCVESKKPIRKIDDFKGLILRVSPVYAPFFKSLGCTLELVEPGDMYSLLERGVVDACVSPCGSAAIGRLYEVADYLLDEPIYTKSRLTVLMNLDKWKTIPADLQEMLIDEMKVSEYDGVYEGQHYDLKALQVLRDNMEVCKFSPEESKTYWDQSITVAWDEVAKVCSPDTIATLKKFHLK